MKIKVLLFFTAAFFYSLVAVAQGSIKGRLADTTRTQALENGTVSVLNIRDSSVVNSAITDTKGNFIITSIPSGKYLLRASFSGYETRYQNFSIDDSIHMLDAGTIYLQLHSNDLGNVTVETSPIVIKQDTTEYNAAMFKTKPNATAEDVLKKLPGVEVDKNGNIKAQGETVQRVLVNGKRFFGDDPKLATQNLPQDVIDKIQVFDDLSDQSKFTGFDDGNRVKTINITTKKSMSSGYFGKASAGIGNKDLYNESANISRMKGEQQITVLAQVNNVNVQNFTVRDILGSGGGRQGGGGGGSMPGGGNNNSLTNNSNGITTTWAGGLNYRDQWGKNTEISGSYFYNNLRTNTEQKTATENFYPGDSSLFNNQQSLADKHNINQRFNLNIESNFDSSNSITIRPNISWQQSDATSESITSTTRGKTAAISTANANTSSYSKGYNGSADVLFKHKFDKKGRTYALSLSFGGSSNDRNGTNYSRSNFFAEDSVSLINQQYTNNTDNKNINAGITYTEPVGKHSILQLDYNYSYNQNNADRQTYDFDSLSGKYQQLNELLTNKYQNDYHSNRVTLNYRIQKGKLNASIGSGVQFGELTSNNETKNIYIDHTFTNMYPTANFSYRFSKTTHLRFNYTGRTSQPSISDLQPTIDNSDPLNITIGNPNLKQSFTNSFRLLFGSFDREHSKNIFAAANASFISNDIVNATITNLKTGVDTLRPINMNGSYNLSAFFNYGFPLKHPKSNLNFNTNFSSTRSAGLITTIDTAGYSTSRQNITNSYSIGETVRWTTNLAKNFDMNFSATPTYNIARYSVQPTQNANYFSLSLSAEPTWYTESGWIVSADFDYIKYSGRSEGYNTAVPLLNASLAKQLFKNKRGELKLSIYDLLNQNISITRTVTENYAKDVQTKVLTRYAMLSFTYNLRSFKQQDRKRNFEPPAPGENRTGEMPAPPPGNGEPPTGGSPAGGTPPF